MALQIPNLDDKKFEDLAQEARALIPRFAREWTDHNVHDPGVTFLELFAWLAEMQIYQLNRISARQTEKFLRLVGLAPLARQAAQVDIAFTLAGSAPGRFLASGTNVVPKSNETRIFETTEDFFLTRTKLERVLTQMGEKSIDQTEANRKEGIQFYAFGERAPSEAILALGFDEPFSDALEANIFFRLHEADLPQLGRHSDEPAHVIPSATLAWEYYSQNDWAALPLRRDTTLHLSYSGRIIFQPPASWLPREDKLYWIRARLTGGAYEIPPLLESILLNVIPATQTQTVLHGDLGEGLGLPDQKVRLNQTPVLAQDAKHWRMRAGDVIVWFEFLQAWRDAGASPSPSPAKRFWSLLSAAWQSRIQSALTLEPLSLQEKFQLMTALNEILAREDLYEPESFQGVALSQVEQRMLEGSACDASPANLFALNRKLFEAAFVKYLSRSGLVLEVQNEAWAWEEWQRVEDFEHSHWQDRHYTLAPESGEIVFGNGQNGRGPLRGKKIRARFYQTSLGAAGNLAADLEWRLVAEDAQGLIGENFAPACEGRDPEPMADAMLRAQEELHTRFRAVTSEDFETLALATPGLRVARAIALPNYHPDLRCVPMPGNVTVVVVPHTRAETLLPEPSVGFLQTIKRHLERHRLLTTAVHVIGPEYCAIDVSCKIFLKKKADRSQVQKRARNALRKFLHPLHGGPEDKGWSFGRAVYASEIYKELDQVEGVDHVVNVKLDAKALQLIAQKKITLPRLGLAYAGELRVEIA